MSRQAAVSEEPREGGARRLGACLPNRQARQAERTGARRLGARQAGRTGAKAASHVWFWALVAAGVVLDLVTKSLAFHFFEDAVTVHVLSNGKRAAYGPAVIPGPLYVTPRRNPGMAWSAGARIPWPALALVTAAIVGVVSWHRHKAVVRAGRRFFDLSMGLILAGAVGNLLDRLFTSTHEVRDFIDVWFGNWSYPVFNLADVFIVAGVIGYVWWGWRVEGRVEAASEEATKAAGSAERD